MISSKERPSEIKLNYLYLTSIAECWHRIKTLEMNDEEVLCHCIDNGEYEWIPRDDIYVCKPEYLAVAAQGKNCFIIQNVLTNFFNFSVQNFALRSRGI